MTKAGNSSRRGKRGERLSPPSSTQQSTRAKECRDQSGEVSSAMSVFNNRETQWEGSNSGCARRPIGDPHNMGLHHTHQQAEACMLCAVVQLAPKEEPKDH